MLIDDTLGAFVDHGRIEVQPTSEGPLSGLTFALKDVFDLAGVPTAAGNPQWLATHPVPTKSTPAVDRLRAAGAKLVGKTHTDELAWSLNGENAHYGTPVNPAAPGRIPGGSSSGSAAATAGGLVDFAIGSDTGGSVRLPASYCGIYGIRTTHGRIPLANAVPLAPSYDVLGWFARSPELMVRVGNVLLDGVRTPRAPKKLLIARDLFAALDGKVRDALQPSVDRLIALVGKSEEIDVIGGERDAWRNAFRVLQSEEAWTVQGKWISAVKPTFGPGVKERFAAAAVLDPAEIAAAKPLRKVITDKVNGLLAGDAVMVLPTVPGIAPLRATPDALLDVFRARAIELLCVAGHAGTPQLSMPVAKLDDCPIGLSIMAARDCDEDLLALAVELGQ
ncbi:amidase [Rhodopseudomonas boonkerdii]|uniref:amidase n=1 Tax=Rhodopseudomonas boonkerdii TaxID=475937 RepID=UPI001E2A3D9F|nr:amidase [Rhodopseudomonas boonkerdii]UGV28170.1 amidase [Rhodopseudomonas boonkerdii]